MTSSLIIFSRVTASLITQADFIAPKESGIADYIGGFAVGVFGAEAIAIEADKENDPYKKMMVQALADRLAEV